MPAVVVPLAGGADRTMTAEWVSAFFSRLPGPERRLGGTVGAPGQADQPPQGRPASIPAARRVSVTATTSPRC